MSTASRLALCSAAALLVDSCRDRAPTPSSMSCSVSQEVALTVAGRGDGVYGVIGEAVNTEPLYRFEDVTLLATDVDAASNKPWLHLHVLDAGARAVTDFTSAPEGRSILVIIGGEVAAHHKIRTPVTGNDFQVSCCNPRACEQWIKRLRGGSSVSSSKPSSP